MLDKFLQRAIMEANQAREETMKKNMYSLMLAEEVIREIDKLAEQNNTNRSNLVNQILAEYVSLTTPEKHIQNIF